MSMIYNKLYLQNGHQYPNRQQHHNNNSNNKSSIVTHNHRSNHDRYTVRLVIRLVGITFIGILILLLYIYIRIVVFHVTNHRVGTTTGSTTSTTTSSSKNNNNKLTTTSTFTTTTTSQQKPSIIATFLNQDDSSTLSSKSSSSYFRRMAMELAKHSPSDILYELNTYDPFHVRKVVQQIHSMELLQNNNINNNSSSSQSIPLSEIQQLFSCSITTTTTQQQQQQHIHHPIMLTYPDLRNMTKLYQYQQQMIDITTTTNKKRTKAQKDDDDINYFIYFQHLRKAGGTHFCTLAQQNIPLLHVPKYYCMPDYYWNPPKSYNMNNNKNKYVACAGCLHRYSNTEILQNMKLYKIAGNEWDNFNVLHHFDLPAIYITSFRQPLHRFVSQYRFECVEARGCTAKSIEQYWNRRRDLYNIYTSTFSDINEQSSFAFSNQPSASQQRVNAVSIAYDTIIQFHLVLVMELLPYSEPLVQSVLGFRDTSILSKRVRPHNNGKNFRTDSWTPEQFLTKEQYTKMSESLALDEILYDVACRIFLERLLCTGAAPK